jgi:hypothetical protein
MVDLKIVDAGATANVCPMDVMAQALCHFTRPERLADTYTDYSLTELLGVAASLIRDDLEQGELPEYAKGAFQQALHIMSRLEEELERRVKGGGGIRNYTVAAAAE